MMQGELRANLTLLTKLRTNQQKNPIFGILLVLYSYERDHIPKGTACQFSETKQGLDFKRMSDKT